MSLLTRWAGPAVVADSSHQKLALRWQWLLVYLYLFFAPFQKEKNLDSQIKEGAAGRQQYGDTCNDARIKLDNQNNLREELAAAACLHK